MNDFVGDAVPEEEEEEEIAEIFLPTVDCLIFGYTLNGKKDLESILVATVDQHKLKYVAQIFASDIPEEAREILMERMPPLQREKPFVKCLIPGTWLKPSLMCRVAYEDWTRKRRLKNFHFRKLLANVKAK